MPSAEAGRDITEGRLSGFTYSRVGNPTVGVLEKRLAAQDGGSFPRHEHVECFTQFAEPEFTLYNETLDHIPQEAYLALLGLETISSRVSKQGSTAERIADFFALV